MAFRAAVARVSPGLTIRTWSVAHAMIREVEEYLPSARLISLDHDLYVPRGTLDPGDGLDVAKHLTSQSIIRPVIVHSSNSDRARMMMGEFELAHWPCTRVLPLGDTWIEDDWQPTLCRILAGDP